jgi:hypothetical protein
LISSNERGGYKRLLFWSYELKFEIFGITPNKLRGINYGSFCH